MRDYGDRKEENKVSWLKPTHFIKEFVFTCLRLLLETAFSATTAAAEDDDYEDNPKAIIAAS
jgi:hypothetical protein